MTWVVSYASPLGAWMIGDVRVSEGDREIEAFGVQKVHAVWPNLLVGFAGTILTGFKMLSNFGQFAAERNPREASGVLSLSIRALCSEWVDGLSPQWEWIAPTLYSRPCDLIVAGIHAAATMSGERPGEQVGWTSNGQACLIHCPVQAGKRAEIVEVSGGFGASSIGSGTGVDSYRRFLEEFDWVEFANWQRNGPSVASVMMQQAIEANPHLGISTDIIALYLIAVRSMTFEPGEFARGPLVAEPHRIARNESEVTALHARHRAGQGGVGSLRG
jgi:hypothetical protein